MSAPRSTSTHGNHYLGEEEVSIDKWSDPKNAARPMNAPRVWPDAVPCRPPEKVDDVAKCIGKRVASIEFIDMDIGQGFRVKGTREAIALHFDDGTVLGFRIGGFENHLHDGRVSLDLVPFWRNPADSSAD